jgi:hypothetical protein
MKRTPQDETVRQLKILNGQLNPMGAFIRLAVWITVFIFTLGLFIKLVSLFTH